jgi:hypothetical protein
VRKWSTIRVSSKTYSVPSRLIGHRVDGAVDFPGDPGCDAASDVSERGTLECDNGLDDDGDGLADAPADPGCDGPGDASERGTQICDNGLDDDGDGLVDYPTDPGCVYLADTAERELLLQVDSTASTTDAMPGDGICADATGACTLPAAVTEASTFPGPDVVSIPEGHYVGDFGVSDDVVIRGAGAGRTVVDGPIGVSTPRATIQDLSVQASSEFGGAVTSAFGFFQVPQVLKLLRVILANDAGYGAMTDGGTLRIHDSAIRDNGLGGISLTTVSEPGWPGPEETTQLELVGTTVSENGRLGMPFGGGVMLGTGHCGGVALIVGSTIARNAIGILTNSWRAALRSTIVADSLLVDCAPFFVFDIVSLGHNLDSDGSCGLSDPTDLSTVDPLLGPLADNGGPTPTHALLAGSPALDAIPPGDCTWDDDGDPATPDVPLATDQRGAARPQGSARDIGAVEVTPCGDGLDNDGDGFTDYPADPACQSAASTRERTQCQDGVNNDGRTGIDFDGGASLNGGVPIAAPDPQCTAAWKNKEAAGGCGLGFELALVLPVLGWLRRRAGGA